MNAFDRPKNIRRADYALDIPVSNVGGVLPEFWPMASFALPEPTAEEYITQQALARLTDACALFDHGEWREAMQIGHDAVWRAQRGLTKDAWQRLSNAIVTSHPITGYMHQDPFTRRSFMKPRGYAGDAVLIDYIYGSSHEEHEIASASPLGRWIYNYASNTMAPRAVRRRKYVIAELIDRVCCQVRNPRIWSIACGHLREMELSHGMQADLFSEFIAFDQDVASLAHIERNASSRKIKPVEGSVRRLIVGGHSLGDFDLVYASGLYDYLDQRAAKRLTDVMFRSLKPGGTLLFANFLKNIYDIGYMESFMGWNLIFRQPAEIVELTETFRDEAEFIRYFEDPERNIGFVLARKASRIAQSPTASRETR